MPKLSSSHAASTSLSAQLKRLQVPQTHLLTSLSDRRRVSFLYDPKEAANLDSEAVYCLAINGLEQLKQIDPETFESFETTLFSSTSVTFERAVQSKQVNQSLDTEIKRFLIHLSPYFMLKPAHKCFEWLVFRYKVM
jgi:U3 small nucleolar RNA-associated protein 10